MTKLAPVDAGTFVVQRAVRAAPSAAALRELAAAKVLDPAILDEHEPFFWRAVISTDQLDAYYTRMAKSSLQNYAEDAKAGVSFQDSHLTNGQERNLGQSVDGRFVNASAAGSARVEADFYTLLGVDDRIDTWVKRIRGGLMPDVSIGFYHPRYVCGVCGNDLLGRECTHWPGFPYEVTDKKGQPTGETATAFAWVEDARLGEASSVADGATPAAAVIKAMRAVEAGEVTPEQARLLEQRYRIRLPGAHHAWAGEGERQPPVQPAPPTEPERAAPTPPVVIANTEGDVELSERILALVRARGAPETAVVNAELAVAWLEGEVERLNGVAGEYERAKPLIADGTAYREAEISAALTNGVRALGDQFIEADWRSTLESMPIERIKLLSAGWAKTGDAQFAGGRATAEQGEHPPAKQTAVPTGVPVDAFRA